MKVKDLIEDKKNGKGTYAGLKFSNDDCDIIVELANQLKLPNPIEKNDIHMTMIYSRKYLPNYEAAGQIDEWAYPKEFHVFDTFDKKRALVLKLDCPFAIKRHNQIMKEHKATYDYPEYIPHITLSYDIEDMEVPEFKNLPKEFHIDTEYMEDLELEWKP
jgi:hypothetical protein